MVDRLQDRELIYTRTLLAPKGESLALVVPVREKHLNVQIHFKDEANPDKSPIIWETVDGVFHLTFCAIQPSSGLRILQNPVQIGRAGSDPLCLLTSIQRHHNAYQVDIQIMLGGPCL